jgi:hypothetical protein
MSDNCYNGWPDGNGNGDCCCNCKFQKKLMCHPSNGNNKEYGWLEDKIKFGKGSISTQCGYMCTLQHPDKSNKDEFQY